MQRKNRPQTDQHAHKTAETRHSARSSAPPQTYSPQHVLQLQRAAGNRAVLSLLRNQQSQSRSQAPIQAVWQTQGHKIKTEDGEIDFTHWDHVETADGDRICYYWSDQIEDGTVYRSENDKVAKKYVIQQIRYLSQENHRVMYPWRSNYKDLLPFNPDLDRKSGGGGGNRTVGADDHKFHVQGEVSPMLLHYLKQLPDWQDDTTGMDTRIPMGSDVPELLSTVPIADPNKMTKDDFVTEDLASGFDTKSVFHKEVLRNHINGELLKAWDGKRKSDGNPGQNAVMKGQTGVLATDGSATEDAGLHGFNKEVGGHGWEWLHLKAYSMGGHQGYAQYSGNLVMGTWHANSAHKTIEDAVKRLARATSEVFRVDVKADVYTGTQVGKTIHYTLSTSSGRSMTFDIDCLMRVRPTSHDEKYWYLIMADKLLSADEAKRVMEDKVGAEVDSLDSYQEEMVQPPSPVHWSSLGEDELDEPMMSVGGTVLDDSELDDERGKGRKGQVFRPKAISKPAHKLKAKTRLGAKVSVSATKSHLQKKFGDKLGGAIWADLIVNGQYIGNVYKGWKLVKYIEPSGQQPATLVFRSIQQV